MANPANRLFSIMQKSGTNTISELIGLTVTEINPLQLSNGDKIILTEEFITFPSYIDKTKIVVGDKFSATSLNDNQLYYINDIISSTNELNIYKEEISELEEEINALKSRMDTAEGNITSLDERVTALENRY